MAGFVRLEKTEIFLNCLSCTLESVFLDRSIGLTAAGSVYKMKNSVDLFVMMSRRYFIR